MIDSRKMLNIMISTNIYHVQIDRNTTWILFSSDDYYFIGIIQFNKISYVFQCIEEVQFYFNYHGNKLCHFNISIFDKFLQLIPLI